MTPSSRHVDGRTAALFALAMLIMVALVVAWRIDAVATTNPPISSYVLQVVDEQDAPIPGAAVQLADTQYRTDEVGTVTLDLAGPALAIVTAPNRIAEPVVIGSPGYPETVVTLLDAVGPNGPRVVMHFGGDFMMGRRYAEPARDDTARATDPESARAVVAEIAPMFGLADLSSVNYESVAGNFAVEDAKASKLYLLQTDPDVSAAALDELGVDIATLGNNHVYDWVDPGMAATIKHLAGLGIAHPGAGFDPTEAITPSYNQVGDMVVATISATTVTGNYVNNRLPGAGSPPPAALSPRDAWQYEERGFGFGEPGAAGFIAYELRRPGPAWELFREAEQMLPPADGADLWHQLSRVYPELQDSVARRGHGGAAEFSREIIATVVAEARSAGATLVIVQLHGSSQFSELPTKNFREAARQAAAAGADLVVGHHPHVIQGFEYHEGTLIAHSLGNIVFDQDFGVTHPSIVLRTVFEGNRLLKAQVHPLVLDRYRPVLVGGEVADNILNKVALASLQGADTIRLSSQSLALGRTDSSPTATVAAHTGVGQVVPAIGPNLMTLTLDGDEPVALERVAVRMDGQGGGLRIGRDLFGYGDLEDVSGDGAVSGGLEWRLPPDSLQVDLSSPAGPRVVALSRTSQHLDDIVARTASRLPIPEHRWSDPQGRPADGPATYSARVWVKRTGSGIPFVRLTFYAFDDTNPTRLPYSASLGAVDTPIPVANDGRWHEVWVDLPQPPDGANAMFAGVGLAPPESQSGTIWVDGFSVVEWRQADQVPEGVWMAADFIARDIAGSITLITN